MSIHEIYLISALFNFSFSFSIRIQSKKYNIHTIAFYNFENLLDTVNDSNANDDEWTPTGAQHWTEEKYHQKLKNISRVISEIGTPENPNAPTILGGSEIENRAILEDLIKEPKLLPFDYGIIHFDSPDKWASTLLYCIKKDISNPLRSLIFPY